MSVELIASIALAVAAGLALAALGYAAVTMLLTGMFAPDAADRGPILFMAIFCSVLFVGALVATLWAARIIDPTMWTMRARTTPSASDTKLPDSPPAPLTREELKRKYGLQ